MREKTNERENLSYLPPEAVLISFLPRERISAFEDGDDGLMIAGGEGILEAQADGDPFITSTAGNDWGDEWDVDLD